jgi:hypothetical protein
MATLSLQDVTGKLKAIKLPEIPRQVSPELYNYYVQLHLNIKQLSEAIAMLQANVAAIHTGSTN